MVPEHAQVVSQIQRIFQIYKNTEGEIRPHFLVTGPSGAGKSHLIQQLCDEFELDYLEVNAAQLTKEGTSGNSLSKALSPLSNRGNSLTVVFVDEFDKLFISGNGNSQLAHEVTNGVQNEFLRVLESKTTSVFGDYGKYIETPVERVLFVFAGAFNGEPDLTLDRLREFGIKTEFLGRVPLVYNLKKLSVESMYQLLNKSTLLEKYLRLFPSVNRDNVVNDIMEAVVKAHETNTLGARLLNTLLNQYFINNGKLQQEQVKQSTFQNTLVFKVSQ
ncbi:Clp protease [Alteromonas phage vB_AcoS-R7M]|uniref:Clp protease n=1 Tax=Alteromonas phage vB_AcoS-R7M TaxID=2729541 RepID=A0A6M3YNA2_9CAUD|nr:Clp protease [Alteromonas phage vB_AcoS-R7M]QJI53382.1 Clp protease [Alteromonas phage vB_AcoS-R7M]